MSYIFDVFPVRPRPQPLEALTSYLSRLAAANGISSCSGFLRWIFPHYTRYAHHITDFPLHDWDALPQVAVLTLAELQAMTFDPVAQHFGRSGSHGSHHLLHRGIAPHFRYCPCCLNESGYAPLIWRFRLVTGCVRHRVPLYEHCPQCGGNLPLLRLQHPLHCPTCMEHLCTTVPQPLTKQAVRDNRIRTADLTALLQAPNTSPILWQTAREAAGVSLDEMARALGCSRRRIAMLEWGRTGMKLSLLIQYCDYLGLCLRDVLAPDTVSAAERRDITVMTAVSRNTMEKQAVVAERDLLHNLQRIADQLRQTGKSVTVTALSQQAHVNTSDLNNYPTVRNWLERVRQHRYVQQARLREAELLAQFEAAVSPILNHSTPFRVGDVCEAVGMDAYNLRKYPSIAPRLDELAVECKRRRQRQQQAVLDSLNEVIARLEAQGAVVTRQALQQEGLLLSQLKRYTATRHRLTDIPDEPRPPEPDKPDAEATWAREQQIYDRVRGVLVAHRQLPVRLTMKAVADSSGVSQTMIRSRPELLAEVRDAMARTPHWPEYTAGEVRARVLAACDALRQQAMQPTLTAIYQQLQWTRAYLDAYPKVKRICRETLRSDQQRQRQPERDELLARVEHYLTASPKVISYAQVARALVCRPEHLTQDDRIRARIDSTLQQKKDEAARQLWERVKSTVLSWQAQGLAVTQQALIQHLNVTVGQLNRHEAVRALLEDIWATQNQQWQNYLDDLTIRAQRYVQQRQSDGLPVTQELIAAHLGVNTSKLDSYPGTRAVFDTLNARRPSQKQQREQILLTQVEAAIDGLREANLSVNQKSIAAQLGRSPKGLKYYPLVRTRLQEVIQANQTL